MKMNYEGLYLLEDQVVPWIAKKIDPLPVQPSTSLGVQPSTSLGVQPSTSLGVQPSTSLAVQSSTSLAFRELIVSPTIVPSAIVPLRNYIVLDSSDDEDDPDYAPPTIDLRHDSTDEVLRRYNTRQNDATVRDRILRVNQRYNEADEDDHTVLRRHNMRQNDDTVRDRILRVNQRYDEAIQTVCRGNNRHVPWYEIVGVIACFVVPSTLFSYFLYFVLKTFYSLIFID
jgi:hypothetical protein